MATDRTSAATTAFPEEAELAQILTDYLTSTRTNTRWHAEISIEHLPGEGWAMLRHDVSGPVHIVHRAETILDNPPSGHAAAAGTRFLQAARARLLAPWKAACSGIICDLVAPKLVLRLDRRPATAAAAAILHTRSPAMAGLTAGRLQEIEIPLATLPAILARAHDAASRQMLNLVGARHVRFVPASDEPAQPTWWIEIDTQSTAERRAFENLFNWRLPAVVHMRAPDAATAILGLRAATVAAGILANEAEIAPVEHLLVCGVAQETQRARSGHENLTIEAIRKAAKRAKSTAGGTSEP